MVFSFGDAVPCKRSKRRAVSLPHVSPRIQAPGKYSLKGRLPNSYQYDLASINTNGPPGAFILHSLFGAHHAPFPFTLPHRSSPVD
jgi:hypothetical protein